MQNGICSSCYVKIYYKLCKQCTDKHEPYFTDDSGDNYCKRCTIIGYKLCVDCKSSIPAGKRGRLCNSCRIKQSIDIKIKYYQSNLSSQTANLFAQYISWAICEYSHSRILKAIKPYYECFLIIEKIGNIQLVEEALLKRHPIQSKPIFIFLKQKDIIQMSSTKKKDIDNQRYIYNQMKELPCEHPFYSLLQSYYEFLLGKLAKEKTTYQSIRLALTPAKDFLKMAIYQNSGLTTALLIQYLWLSPGQRASITGFINFLRDYKNIDISIPSKKEYTLEKIKQPRLYYEKQLIMLLRDLEKNNYNVISNKFIFSKLLRLSLNTLHEIHIPSKIILTPKKLNNADNTIYLLGRFFYLGSIYKLLK